MNITGFIWQEKTVQKLLWKHNLEIDEVAELFQDDPRFYFVEKGRRKGENVYAASGRTEAGRYLICYFIYKSDRRALILSARDMTQKRA